MAWYNPFEQAGKLIGSAGKGMTPDIDTQVYDPNEQNFNLNRHGQVRAQENIRGLSGRSSVQDVGRQRVTAGSGADPAQIEAARQEEIRKRQMGLAGQLQLQASGQGTSAGQMLLKQGMERNIAAASAQAASAPGMNPGLARRLAMQQQTQVGLETQQQQAILEAQEQQQAQQALGDLLSGTRRQDIDLATTQSGYEQEASMQGAEFSQEASMIASKLAQDAAQGNQDAQLKMQQMNDDMIQKYLDRGLTEDVARLNAKMEMERLIAGDVSNQNQMAMGQAGMQMQGTGAILAGGGAAISKMSDRLRKKNISKGAKTQREIKAFLGALTPNKFDYIDDTDGGSDNYGFMAQDAEKTTAGRSMILDTPRGKMFHKDKALMMALASAAHLNKRLGKLEKAA